MSKSFKTSFSFLKNVFTVGAISETNPKTVEEICSKIDVNNDVVVVEFGMGHGNMTEMILNKISKDSKLYSFEINSDFCKYVEKNIQDTRLKIINDSALNFKKHIDFKVDNFIISIPFTFLKNKDAENLVKSCFDILRKNGFYSQVVYRDKTLLNSIGNRSFEKSIVKTLLKEKIFHVKN